MIDIDEKERFAEIEKDVVGLMFLFADELRGEILQTSPDDFAIDLYREMFAQIREAVQSREQVTTAILCSVINPSIREPLMRAAEGQVTLAQFPQTYARFKELATVRRLREKTFALAMNPNLNISDLQKILDEEQERSTGAGIRNTAERNFEQFLGTLGEHVPRVMTGFETLDRVLGGLRYSTVCHIGARPSTGKTTFALNIANANLDKPVLFFSLEMSAGMIFERVSSMRGKVDYQKFSNETLTKRDIAEIREDMGSVKQSGNFMVIDDVYSIESISNACLQIKPKIVIIDYIQKITTARRTANVREQIEYISGELKRIAKACGCVVIALSQLTRAGKEAPTMSDLKESGALEADGDYICLLHRPYVLDKRNPRLSPEQAEVIVDKNKFGSCGKVDMRFRGCYQTFEEGKAEKLTPLNDTDGEYYGVPF
jgi:replicative DNA helicase